MSLTDTAIIGAGPYGLSLAAHLAASGVPHQILGQPMDAWRNVMPPGMLLRSEAFASSLHAPQRGFTLEAYYRQNGIPYQPMGMAVPLETFVDYALWFQSRLVGNIRTVHVVNLQQIDGHFQLALSDGASLRARKVVIALGLKGFALCVSFGAVREPDMGTRQRRRHCRWRTVGAGACCAPARTRFPRSRTCTRSGRDMACKTGRGAQHSI